MGPFWWMCVTSWNFSVVPVDENKWKKQADGSSWSYFLIFFEASVRFWKIKKSEVKLMILNKLHLKGLDPLKCSRLGMMILSWQAILIYFDGFSWQEIPMRANNHGSLETDTILCKGNLWSCGDIPFAHWTKWLLETESQTVFTVFRWNIDWPRWRRKLLSFERTSLQAWKLCSLTMKHMSVCVAEMWQGFYIHWCFQICTSLIVKINLCFISMLIHVTLLHFSCWFLSIPLTIFRRANNSPALPASLVFVDFPWRFHCMALGGQVLILLASKFRGRRVVFLKQTLGTRISQLDAVTWEGGSHSFRRGSLEGDDWRRCKWCFPHSNHVW